MNTLQWRAAKSSKIVRMLFTHRRYVLMHKGCASSRQPLIRWLHVIDFYLLFLYRYMSIKLFLNLFIYLSMYLSIFVCRSLSICLCLSLIHTPSDCLSVCVSAYLSLTQAIRHYLSLLVTSPSLTSCHLTISHFLSPHHLSLLVTSPSLTSCHHLSLLVTISHFLSPSLTSCLNRCHGMLIYRNAVEFGEEAALLELYVREYYWLL